MSSRKSTAEPNFKLQIYANPYHGSSVFSNFVQPEVQNYDQYTVQSPMNISILAQSNLLPYNYIGNFQDGYGFHQYLNVAQRISKNLHP